MWIDSRRVKGPRAGQILVDTGPLSVGAVNPTIFTWTNDAPVMQIEHIDATGLIMLHSQTFAPGDIAPGGFFFTIPMVLLVGESIRVSLLLDIGEEQEIHVSIFLI